MIKSKDLEQLIDKWKAPYNKLENIEDNVYRGIRLQGGIAALKEALKRSKRPSNTQLKLDGLKCLASPCPCTAVKMNQCREWCRFYPPTT